MKSKSVLGLIFAAMAALTLGSTGSQAFPSGGYQSTPYNGSAFSSSCVGHNFQGFGLGSLLGTDLSTHGFRNAANGPANCNASTSSGIGTAASTASDGGPIGALGGSFSGNTSGQAQTGIIKLQATENSTMTGHFTGAASNGGWNDSYTVGGGTGQGLWVIPIQVTGNINAQAAGTTAIVQLMPYVNSSPIFGSPAQNGAALGQFRSLNTQNNGDVISAFGFEIISWGAVNHGSGDPLTQFAVNEIVNLVIPITYGLSVDMGIYASSLVGERAQTAARGYAEADFDSTITWLGQGYVLDWDAVNGVGDRNDNITVTAESGQNYNRSFATAVPEPSSAVIFCLAIALIGVARRTTQFGRA